MSWSVFVGSMSGLKMVLLLLGDDKCWKDISVWIFVKTKRRDGLEDVGEDDVVNTFIAIRKRRPNK